MSFAESTVATLWLPTCQWVDQFRRLHIIQVCKTVPGSCDHLPAPDQPVSCNHDPLVTFHGRCRDPDSGDLTKALAIHLPFFSVWRVLVVITGSLQVNKANSVWMYIIRPSEILHDKVHASKEQSMATHTDIWWWLGGGKLHHVAPDVSRLVPWGWSEHHHTKFREHKIQIDTELTSGNNRGGKEWEGLVTRDKLVPVRAICSVGWNLMELTVRKRMKMKQSV